MGKMQRSKGARFERLIATKLRDAFPRTDVRRARQSEGAFLSDVYFNLGPWPLRRVWFELTHSHNPDPWAKLDQAERDVEKLGHGHFPVVVYRKTGGARIFVMLRYNTLQTFLGRPASNSTLCMIITWDDFLDLLRTFVRVGLEGDTTQ